MSDPKVDIVDQDLALGGDAVNENGQEVSAPETKEEAEKVNEEISSDAVKANASDPVEEKSTDKTEEKEYKTNGHSKSDSRNFGNKGKYDNKRRDRGSKFDPSVVPITDDATKIRNQVEFYFGDSNLPTDKHLWNLTDGAENKPVLINEIHKFGRMTRFQPYSAVVEALRASKTLEVTGEEGEETVARKVAYNPNQPKHASLERSVYVKGFGEELPSSQFDIEAFFTPYGPTNAVRLRRSDDKVFKGSVFVEFADEETAKKFLNLDPKPQFKGGDLQIMSKKDYEALRIQEIKDGKREPNKTRGPKRGGFKNSDRGGRDRDDRDPDDWKKRREDDQRSGFRDNKRDHRGRGGRGGRRGGDRRPRDNDRNREGEEAEDKNGSKDEEPSRKRARDDDAGNDEKQAKKVDTKEVPVENS